MRRNINRDIKFYYRKHKFRLYVNQVIINYINLNYNDINAKCGDEHVKLGVMLLLSKKESCYSFCIVQLTHEQLLGFD